MPKESLSSAVLLCLALKFGVIPVCGLPCTPLEADVGMGDELKYRLQILHVCNELHTCKLDRHFLLG